MNNLDFETLEKNAIEYFDNDPSVIISLLITQQCNFRCAHCMYGDLLGPSPYMSNEVLQAVWRQVQTLQQYGAMVRINLIGGEPTINLNEFKRILDEVASWPDVTVEMTTNGHFLYRDVLATRFFEIVSPYVHDETLVIRVSNDQYHNEFRKIPVDIASLDDRIGELIYKEVPYLAECFNCNEEYELDSDFTGDFLCPECNEICEISWEYDEYNTAIDLPPIDESSPWIYIEMYKRGADHVIKIGNAESWGNINWSYHNGCSSGYNVLSYDVDGNLLDICCRGSRLRIGSVNDDPYVLLTLANDFIETKHPTCDTCWDLAEEYKEDRSL